VLGKGMIGFFFKSCHHQRGRTSERLRSR